MKVIQAFRFLFGLRLARVTAHTAFLPGPDEPTSKPLPIICINVANLTDHNIQVVWAGILTKHMVKVFLQDTRALPVIIPPYQCWEIFAAIGTDNQEISRKYAKMCYAKLATGQLISAQYVRKPLPIGIIPGDDCYRSKPSSVANLRAVS